MLLRRALVASTIASCASFAPISPTALAVSARPRNNAPVAPGLVSIGAPLAPQAPIDAAFFLGPAITGSSLVGTQIAGLVPGWMRALSVSIACIATWTLFFIAFGTAPVRAPLRALSRVDGVLSELRHRMADDIRAFFSTCSLFGTHAMAALPALPPLPVRTRADPVASRIFLEQQRRQGGLSVRGALSRDDDIELTRSVKSGRKPSREVIIFALQG